MPVKENTSIGTNVTNARRIECFALVLCKLVKNKDIPQVTEHLEQRKLVSQGQRKRFCEHVKKGKEEVYVRYIYNAFKNKEKLFLQTIKNTLDCKEFPVSDEGKSLLSYILRGTNATFVEVLEKWNQLCEYETVLKPLLPDESSDEDWIQVLLFAAFREVLSGDGDKKILDAIQKIFSEQKKADSLQNKMSAPESDSVSDNSEVGTVKSIGDASAASNTNTNEKEQHLDAQESSNGHGDAKKQTDSHAITVVPKNDDESTIYILPAEDLHANADENAYLIEFRAVVSNSCPIPEGKGLSMAFEENQWKAMEMAYDKRKKFYFLRILFNKKHGDRFQFKFCYKADEETTIFECLRTRDPLANRSVNLAKMKKQQLELSLHACLFKEEWKSWMDRICVAMRKFLPGPRLVKGMDSQQEYGDFGKDILALIHTMECGWNINSTPLAPRQRVKDVLLTWLRKVSKALFESQENAKRRIMVSLLVCIALQKYKVNFQCAELHKLLVEMLRMDGLAKGECEELYANFTGVVTRLEESGWKLPFTRDMMHRLYHMLGSYPNDIWIYSLPLYWLLVHGAVKSDVVEEESSVNLTLGRASLPSHQHINWDYVRRQSLGQEKFRSRKNMLDMSITILELAKVHPWIVQTYLCMLKFREIAKLIEEKNDIAQFFHLDVVVYVFLTAIEMDHYDEKDQVGESLQEYVHGRIELNIQSRPPFSEADIKCCLAILQHIANSVKPKQGRHCTRARLDWIFNGILSETLPWLNSLQKQQNPETRKQIRKYFDEILNAIKTGIHRRNLTTKEVEFWGKLLHLKWNMEDLDAAWKEGVIHETQNAINNFVALKRKKEDFLEYFAVELDSVSMHPDVERCFSEKAYAVTVSLMQEANDGGWFRKIGSLFKRSTHSRVIPIFEKLFIREYERTEARATLVQTRSLLLLCTWMFSVQFIQLFGEFQAGFSKDSSIVLERVIKSFRAIIQSLRNGHVTVEHLRIISQNKDNFLMLCGILDKSSSVDASSKSIDREIDVDECHLEDFEKTRFLVKEFILVCNYADYGDRQRPHHALQTKVEIDINQVTICDLVTVDEQCVVDSATFFGVTRDDLEEFERVVFLKDSKKVFRKWFCEALDALLFENDGEIALAQILMMWNTEERKVLQLMNDVESGEISVSDIMKKFKVLNGVKQDIHHEVELLYKFFATYGGEEFQNRSIRNKDLRKAQIHNIFELERVQNAMTVLLSLRQLLNLQGNFSMLTKYQDILLKQSSVSLDKVPADLKMSSVISMSPIQIEVLRKFMSCESIIVWLQEKMTGMNEVKVMCDLAMISAGEDALEVGRVQCLLNGAMGFASLVFWNDPRREEDQAVSQKREAGFPELLYRCGKVWKNVEDDPSILEDWEEAERQLHWFKDVEKFYGSVEKSSLTKAQEINNRGVYVISKKRGDCKLSVDNSISLSLRRDKEQVQNMTLEELRELQSKLMLIAGDADKGQRDVNLFIEVLSSVEKLAEIYVKLESSGCMLFNGWKAVIACNGNNESDTNKLSIQVVFSEDVPPLIGQGSHIDLDRITEILRQSLNTWDDHVAGKRTEHYYLNEFNINQIMYLCHEMTLFETTLALPDQVRTLLSFVREDFTNTELLHSLISARRKFESELNTGSVESESSEDSADEEDESKTPQRLWKVVKLLRADDVQEREAKAAVQCVGCDITECQLWVLENQHDSELITELSEEFDESYGHLLANRKAEVVKSAFQHSCKNTLHEVVSRLQSELSSGQYDRTFQDSIKTICSGYLDETLLMDLQDHLSIGLLGETVFNLSKPSPIQRKKIPLVHQGRPSLLVCGEDEILPTVISMYMTDSEQRLPSRSEVLVCSEETTKCDVERFVRRAMLPCETKGALIHTLASADKLNYANSVALVETYTKLLKCQNLDPSFQMVIVLTKQQHFLDTYFNKDLVDGKWTKSREDICQYLAKQLKVTNIRESAACVVTGCPAVKVVSSKRSGVGKSLYVQRKREDLMKRNVRHRNVTIRLLENKLHLDSVIGKMSPTDKVINNDTILVHLDITPAVQCGIESFLFNLFVLGSIEGSDGKVWRRHDNHLYLVEITNLQRSGKNRFSDRHILNLLPRTKCIAPREILDLARQNNHNQHPGMDENEFQSETFQRPYQYLFRYQNNMDFDDFEYSKPDGNTIQCIEVLLGHCSIVNPSWAQLRHFCSFLNHQLKNCEKSVFCNNPYVRKILPKLKLFTVRFMIKMSQDFATPSLTISDTSTKDVAVDAEFQAHQLRRKWEEGFHPYVFFNEDGHSLTFVNVKLDRQGNLLDKNNRVIERITTPELTTALHQNNFNLSNNFDEYPRSEKLRLMCQVLGIDEAFDPDLTYELTTDNVLKILAIYTRFKCGIPVIIMGETGCGKTRLVEFMSKLKSGRNREALPNMTTLKIHGGITVRDIHDAVETAIALEKRCNRDYAVLFCDEANTTEAIYAIKEVMCDQSIDGKSFADSKLKVVAACNPYKKLSKEALKKLEDSGLGYRVRADKTAHLFGDIPVRSLVYRVVALPPSMQPFVWDFGQLNDEAELIYIQQMTKKLCAQLRLRLEDNQLLYTVFSKCQHYMKNQTNECRYVSLRDVERCIITFEWFWKKRAIIYPLMLEELSEKYHIETAIGDVARAVILTVGVCYHASLDERAPFRSYVSRYITEKEVDANRVDIEITCCQLAFLRNVRVGRNIARNHALRENVFMMAICTDMKIPLFLVGKPGSSKSLAKTIITNNMQGQTSHAKLYQTLKQIHILSYQCSALTDASGIQKVFNQCAQLQKKQNLDAYTAVVVLDEIGLAEDSPNMPLKILHPLLERRSGDLSTVNQADSDRVGFIGISNWALDPAKMNRGIFLTRNKPEESDLRGTGKEIFQDNKSLWNNNERLFGELTKTYVDMYKDQTVEYFGLRDYYSLMKMICTRCQAEEVSFDVVLYAVSRNFGGSKEQVIQTFLQRVRKCFHSENVSVTNDTVPIQTVIRDNLSESKSRFLLLLANQFSVVSLLESCVKEYSNGLQVVFGSGFPGDHSYTEICRNINKIKACMETGKTVVLLNMANIHESLYDALNQHFVTMGKQNFVDLGLGGHRVKCRISNDFRLIIIEKKEVVFREYPIPLINRLEKHHFSSESLLCEREKACSFELQEWARNFGPRQSPFTRQHVFIGYHDDTPGSVVFTSQCDKSESFKEILLQSCTMDAIFRLRGSPLSEAEIDWIWDVYFEKQKHESLADVLRDTLSQNDRLSVLEITSFSGALWEKDKEVLELVLELPKRSITLVPLEQFHTQQEYVNRLDRFFEKCNKNTETPLILLVQCAQAQLHGSLISCARYCLMNRIRDFRERSRNNGNNVTVCVLLSTERRGLVKENVNTLVLQHTRESSIIHVDELRHSDERISPAGRFLQKSLRDVFESALLNLDNESESESLIQIESLLVESIPECVAIIRDPFCEQRNLQRLEILINLCREETDLGRHFRKIIMTKVTEAFVAAGDRFGEGMSWIVRRAENAEVLQDAGTFRKALWLGLKSNVSRILAYIVSIIDRNNNLDIISQPSVTPWKMELWIGMFAGLQVPWVDGMGKSQYIVKRGRNSLIGCSLPFSFVVIDFLESQWEILTNLRSDITQDSIAESFREFNTRHIVTQSLVLEKVTVMKGFVSDLVSDLYKCGTDSLDELQLVSEVVFEFSLATFRERRQSNDFKEGDEIPVMYVTFKGFSQKLEILAEVLRRCPQVLQNSRQWMKKQSENNIFQIHILAFKDVVALLKQKANNIIDPSVCVEWIDLAREARVLYDMVTHDEESCVFLKDIDKDWIPLCLLDTLLMQLLPPAHVDDEMFKNFVKTISHQAQLFWKGSEKCDPRSMRFLRIVVNVLKRCSLDIELHLLTGWRKSICKICEKIVKVPTFLPCQHFGCENCIRQSLMARNNDTLKCQICNAEVGQDFVAMPKQLNEYEQSILFQMKRNCNGFFLEFLKRFCLDPQNTVMSQMELQLKQIIKDLIVQDSADRPELDPVGFDMNINFRSCILKLLLDYNKEFVTFEINHYLQNVEGAAFDSLVAVAINSFAQNTLRKIETLSDEQAIGFYHKQLRISQRYLENNDEGVTLKIIQEVSMVRCALRRFAELIKNLADKTVQASEIQPDISPFIKDCLNYLENAPEVVQEYLLKYGAKNIGLQWIKQLLQHDDYKILVPQNLAQAVRDRSADFWVLLGAQYTEMKSYLLQNDPEDVESAIAGYLDHRGNRLPHALAVISWMNEKEREVRCAASGVLRHKCRDFADFFRFCAIEEQRLRSAIFANCRLDHRAKLLYQTCMIIVSCLTDARNVPFRCFNEILHNPAAMQDRYLPTMPEHHYFSFPVELRTSNYGGLINNAMYTCPKGHVYTIDDCTQAVIEANCPDCGETIGGKQHRSATGNEKISMNENTQAGYKRSNANGGHSTGPERMTVQGNAATQFILHTTMLVSSVAGTGNLTGYLGLGNIAELHAFLVRQLDQNIQELARGLARNVDEAALLLIRVMLRMPDLVRGRPMENWSTMENRKTWESRFLCEYLRPVFSNIEEELAIAHEAERDADRVKNAPVTRLMRDMRPADDSETAPSWESPMLWTIVESGSVRRLAQALQDTASKGSGEVLREILKSSNLECLKHLPSILEIQQNLVERYQYKLDLEDADKMTLRNHIERENVSDEALIKNYVKAWNELFPKLKPITPNFLLKFLAPITLDSPLCMALPSIRGRGQCAKQLTKFLVDTHNRFLSECVKVMKPLQNLQELDAHQLTESDFIRLNKDKDLAELVELHTSYSITTDPEHGRRHRITYNFDALEKQVRERYVFCKKMIKKNSLPCMEYLQDVGIGVDWNKLESAEQEPLTVKLCQDIDTTVAGSHSSDLCERVRTLTVAIKYLTRVKLNPEKSLHEFLEKDLKLPQSRSAIIPRDVQVSHVLSLYKRLTWHKALIFVKQGHDPYKEALSSVSQEDITGSLLGKTRQSLETVDIPKLQQIINEMVITGTGMNDADWSLVEAVFPALDEDDSWYEKLPNELCNKHLSHLFKETVLFECNNE